MCVKYFDLHIELISLFLLVLGHPVSKVETHDCELQLIHHHLSSNLLQHILRVVWVLATVILG